MKARVMIPCRKAHELISLALDQRLGPGQRFQLGLHLALCKLCARVEVQMKTMRKAMRSLAGN